MAAQQERVEQAYGLDHLERLYQMPNPGEVGAFLNEHPSLEAILLEAHPAIRACFGADPAVSLRLVRDPEAPGDRQLVAFVQSDLEPHEALDRLDQFDERWGLEATLRSSGKVSVHLE